MSLIGSGLSLQSQELSLFQRVQPIGASGCFHEFHLECVISQLLNDHSHFVREQAQLRQGRHLCLLRSLAGGHCAGRWWSQEQG